MLLAVMVLAPQLGPIAGIPRDAWFVLLMGIFCLIEGARGIRTGNSIFFFRDVTRSNNGFLYWGAIGILLAGGIFCLADFVRLLVS